jgi:hypothetical protein
MLLQVDENHDFFKTVLFTPWFNMFILLPVESDNMNKRAA